MQNIRYVIFSCLFWGLILRILYLYRPGVEAHKKTIEQLESKKYQIKLLVVVAATILMCILPMGVSPIWNGTIEESRNQYEIMAESIKNGHIYLDYGWIDPLLLEMENPYDPELRTELGVTFQWDHAFYNGHYYMYFGVVPVFLLFFPYLLLTGTSLTTYRATQIFVGLFIAGVFAVFYLLAKKFFPKMSPIMYVSLAVAFSVMSVWYSVGAPALYCTAITSALCMEIWSFYFFINAVWIEDDQNIGIRYAFCGSLLGALAFGCRPPIALANLLVLPLLYEYLRKRKIDLKLVGQLIFAALPYIVIGILLMVYNYVRFDNVFEFGQSYQLTVADIYNYADSVKIDAVTLLSKIISNFFGYKSLTTEFPYVSYNGVMINFPILWFILIGLGQENVWKTMKEKKCRFFVGVLLALPVIITVLDTMWSPYLLERYRMDIYWLMGIAVFFIIGLYYMNLSEEGQYRASFMFFILSIITIMVSVLLFLLPHDGNFTMVYPEVLETIRQLISFGRGTN